MDMLILLGIVAAWGLVACILPMRERRLRALYVANTLIIAMALCAISVAPPEALSFLGVGRLFLIPLALVWIATAIAHALWWGMNFKNGTGARPLFVLRSVTLFAAFVGLAGVFLAPSLPLALLAGTVTAGSVLVAGLYGKKTEEQRVLRTFSLGILGYVVLAWLGVLAFYISALPVWVAVGLVCVSIAGIAGALPLAPWYQRGILALPNGHRIALHIFLPVALALHMLASATASSVAFVLGILGACAVWEYVRAGAKVSTIFATLFWASAWFTMSYGPAGSIPAVMTLLSSVLLVSALVLAWGGTWWTQSMRKVVVTVACGFPIVSPLFLALGLSVGFGLQMSPVLAVLHALVLFGGLFAGGTRILHAWSEDEPSYAEVWSSRFAFGLCIAGVIYGVWFLHADTLGLIISALGDIAGRG